MWAAKRFLLLVLMLASREVAYAAEFIEADRATMTSGTPTTVYMVGEIVQGDYDRFVALLRRRGPAPINMELRSGGGNTYEAMRIGRLVRELSIWVAAPNGTQQNIHQASCAIDYGRVGRSVPCICASACTLIWFGGVMRNGIEIYIHSVRYDHALFGSLSPPDAAKMYQKTMGEISSYLSEMDVDQKYAHMMGHTASTEIRKVSFWDDSSLFSWIPAYREWLFAKCGNPPSATAQAMAWGQCTVKAHDDGRVDGGVR